MCVCVRKIDLPKEKKHMLGALARYTYYSPEDHASPMQLKCVSYASSRDGVGQAMKCYKMTVRVACI